MYVHEVGGREQNQAQLFNDLALLDLVKNEVLSCTWFTLQSLMSLSGLLRTIHDVTEIKVLPTVPDALLWRQNSFSKYRLANIRLPVTDLFKIRVPQIQ